MLRNCAELRRALAIGAILLTPGCNLDSLFGHDGARVQVVLSRDGGSGLGAIVANMVQDSVAARNDDDDDDHHRVGTWGFQTATVTLSSILARTLDGELVNLDVDLPVTVDVVKIDDGKQIQLPDGFLPADTYDQIVVVMTAVQGTLRDGTIVTIEPPGGGWTAVIPTCPLEVTDATTTTVGLALNVRNSFVLVGSQSWSFQPRFRSMVDCSQNSEDGDA